MSTSVNAPSAGELGALASTPSATPGTFGSGTFAGVDPDETLAPAEEGAKGVINVDMTGDSGDIGAPGPAAAR